MPEHQAPSGIQPLDAQPASAFSGDMNNTNRITRENQMNHNAPTPNTLPRSGRTRLHCGVRPDTAPPRARFAGLVDIENTLIVQDHLLPAAQQGDVFEVLDSSLAGIPVRAAAGARVVKACMPELASRGWGLTLVTARPDAADRALIEAGRQMAASGVIDLVIVSGDHAFAALASVARLHVIARRGCLSRRLRLAATTITHLPALQNHTHAIA